MKPVMRSSTCLALFAVCMFLQTAAWGGSSETPSFFLDPTTGNIDGTTAVAMYPVRYENHSFEELLDPAGHTVHLVPQEDPDLELVYPAGQWFLPLPRHRYRIWIEGEWSMTPYTSLMSYGGSKFSGRGMSSGLPLAPAGLVTLPADVEPRPDLVFRLLLAAPHHEGDIAKWEMTRRRPSDEVGEGLLMPAGPVVAALWDEKRQAHTALSRPFKVLARQSVAAPLERPREKAYLLLRLQRDTRALSVEDYLVEPLVVQGGQKLPPDVKAPTTTHLYAIWYDLEPGSVEVEAHSPTEFLPPHPLDLRPGTIERLDEKLRPRPDLEVELVLPERLREERLTLELRSVPEGEIIASEPLPPAPHSHRFESVPPSLLEVELQTDLGSFSTQVDLGTGEDGLVRLEPELVTVSGTVRLGDDAHPAKLTFQTVGRATVEATADASGVYEVVLLEPLRSVEVELPDAAMAPYFDFFPRPITASTTLDFDFPTAAFRVRVLDAVSGQGIERASVDLRNVFVPEPGEDGGEEHDKAVVQLVETDAQGQALLPPLRLGSLELRAAADGYLRQQQPVTVPVTDLETDRVFELVLEPIGETETLVLRLPGGAPASGAEITWVDSLAGGRSLFSTRADDQGSVEAPRLHGAAFALVKHPAASFLVREWPPGDQSGPMTWTLPAAAERPLSLQITDPQGEGAAPRAELALWLDGRRLHGRTLAWLTGGRPMADRNGFWQARNLPRSPVSILAWEVAMRAQAGAGSLDGLAVEVTYPWPERIEVAVVR